jgi:GNAT superfamily N-acetyltransferase
MASEGRHETNLRLMIQPPPPPAPPFSIACLGATALPAMVDLARACYGERAEPPEWWRWYHFGEGSGEVRVLIAKIDGKPAGMQPLTVLPFARGTERFSGAVLTGGMVHPGYRRRGIFRALVRESVHAAFGLGASFVTTMPNADSYPAFRSLGWKDPGERTLMVRPLLRGPRSATRRVEIRSAERAEPDWVALGEKAFPSDPPLLQIREPRSFGWRYFENPMRRYHVLEARSAAGELLGVAVGTTQRRRGLPIGFIVDFLAVPGDAARELFDGILAALWDEGARFALAVVSEMRLAAQMKAAGFRRVPAAIPTKRFYTVYTCRPGAQESHLPPPEIGAWHQMLADWDGI